MNQIANNFTNVLDVLTPDIVAAKMQYCQHTGKPCGEVAEVEINACIKAHGIVETVRLLKLKQKCVATEWISLNAEGLNKLAIQQPKEYFIYACGIITYPPDDEPHGTDYLAFENKVNAWQNLQSIDESIIRPIAEIVRRLLCKAPPVYLAKHLVKITNMDIATITQSLVNLTRFQLACESLLKKLIAVPLKQDSDKPSSFSTFSQQKRTIALSELEVDILNEFNDFEIIADKKPDAIEAIVGRTYGNKKNKQNAKTAKFKGEAIVNPEFTGLKLGGGK